jgi:hypothetical protein
MKVRRIAAVLCLLLGLIAVIMTAAWAQSAAPTTATAPKTAAEAFKNIQVLKDAPADQLIPAMQFISASLGVGCEYCHVRGAFEKDDKEPKQVARKMYQMMNGINQGNFEGHREVTCYSCHHGSAHPMAVPTVMAEDTPPAMPGAEAPPANLPAGDALVDKYLQALGSDKDVRALSSRSEKGKAILFPGREFPVENFYQGADKAASVTQMPDGDMLTGYNQHGGWQITAGRPPHEMNDAELSAAKLDSTFYFPLHLKEMFNQFRTVASDKVGDRAAYVVMARREGQPPIRLAFDQESGLLLRLVRFDETPVGRMPVQTDFSDYRDVKGVKVPFQRVTARPARRMTVKIEQVENNAAIDDSKFQKPAPATTPAPPTAPR